MPKSFVGKMLSSNCYFTAKPMDLGASELLNFLNRTVVMAYSGNTGFNRLIKATQFTRQGILAAYQHEEAFRQEVWLTIVLIPLGIYLGDNGVEKALLVGSVLLLPIVEILNSAIEAVVDRIGQEKHELSGRAKDMGSAAVALTVLLVIVVWGLVLFG
jgi:diacylglycerol kinase (ATP)